MTAVVIGAIGFTLGAGAVGLAWLTLGGDAAGSPRDGGVPAPAAQGEPLRDALRGCVEAGGRLAGMELGDNNTTLIIDVKGEEDLTGADYSMATCVLSDLSVSSAAMSHIGQTTSLDGRQTESWPHADGTVTFSWSYHPDRGLDGVLTFAHNS